MKKATAPKNRVFAGILAMTCAAALMVPGAAFAADAGISADAARNQDIEWAPATSNSGDTTYWLQLEQADMGQISIDVPVKVVLAVNTDGTFVTPTAEKNLIENNSEFPVNVSAVDVTAKDNFNLKAGTGFDALADANIFHGNISIVDPSDFSAPISSMGFMSTDKFTANTAWAMQHSDSLDNVGNRSGSDCLFVQIDGEVGNVSGHYFTAPINVFDVTYTFEATSAGLGGPINLTD